MKGYVAIAVLAAGLAGCSNEYQLAQPSKDFVTAWNDSVPGKALHLKPLSGGGYISEGGDFSLSYGVGGWSLITTVSAKGDMLCTELLIRTTGMSYDRATGLVDKTVRETSVKDGNLRFYMNRLGGGVSCSVDVAKPAT